MTDVHLPSELLTKAWASTSGDSAADRLARMSLGMSASNRPDLAPTLAALESSHRTELDLHLEGAGVRGHETSAESFGVFVTRTARAVKEVVKSRTNRMRYSANLQVLGPALGSVRVVFRSPLPLEQTGEREGLSGVESDTVEGAALTTVVSLMALAESAGPADEKLDESLRQLHGAARSAIRLMAQSVVDGKWAISGQLKREDGRLRDVSLSEAAAQRLVVAAHVTEDEISPGHAMTGVVDGWVWSNSKMTFLPEPSGSVTAKVPVELQQEVAHLIDNQNRARAVFTIVTTYPPGDEKSASRSYELTSISEIKEEPTLDYSESAESSSQDSD